jgi:hypothetical protein
MIRKIAIALAAVAALGTVSLTATTADAKGKGGKGFHSHHGHGHGHWRGHYGLGFAAYDSCFRNVWVVNRFGHTVPRRIYVCD